MNPFRSQPDDQNADELLPLAKLLRQLDESADSGEPVDLDLDSLSANELQKLSEAKECIDLLRQLGVDQNDSTIKPQQATLVDHERFHESRDDVSATKRKVDRYAIKRLIGEGGFAQVFLAHDPALNRDVALKISHANVLTSDAAKARFIREAEAAATLSHPNIVPVFDSGSDGKTMYISFGYCGGKTLAQYKGQFFSQRDAARIVASLADAVGHAHDRGIIHRDLKPGNILIEERSDEQIEKRLRIADFGLARNTLEQQQTLTMTGALVGTPAYMSPEQVRSDPELGPATDIYALGVILFELLTGQQPHTREHFVSTLRAIEELPPPALRSINRNIPVDLEAICLKCLNKDPEERYASAFELYDDLHHWLDGKPIKAKKAGWPKVFAQWCQRNPLIAASLLFAFVSLAFGTGVATLKWIDAEHEKTRAIAATEKANRESKRAGDLLATFADTYRQINLEEGGSDLTASQILKLTYDQVKTQLANDPKAQAEMYQLLADCFHGLGRYEPALQCQIDKNSIIESGTDFLDIVYSRQALMSAYRRAGQFQESLQIQEETVARCKKELGVDDPVTIRQQSHLGICLIIVGRSAEGIELERSLLEQLETNPELDIELTVYVANRFASALDYSNEDAQVIDLYEQRIAEFEARLTDVGELALLADAKRNYSRALNKTGKKLKAIRRQQEAVALREKIGNTKRIISEKRNLASCFSAARQYEEAAKVMQEAVDLTVQEYGIAHPKSIEAESSLAVYLRDVQGFDTAIALQKKAIENSSRVLGDSHSQTIDSMFALGKSYRLNGQYELAVAIAEDAVSKLALSTDTLNKVAEKAYRELARSYAAAGMMNQALQHYEKLIALRARKYGIANPQVLASRIELMMQQIRIGNFETVELSARAALDSLRAEHRGTRHEHRLFHVLAYALERQGKWGESKTLARKVIEADTVNSRTIAHCKSILGACQANEGRTKRAERLLLESFEILESTWLDMHPQNYRSSMVRPQTRFVVQHAAARTLDLYQKLEKETDVNIWQDKLTKINEQLPAIRQ